MCGVITVVGSDRSGWPAGSVSVAKTSSPAPAITRSRSAATSAASSTIGPREVLTRYPRGPSRASSAAPTRRAVRSERLARMDTMSALAKRSALVTSRAPHARALAGEVLAPGDDVHVERARVLRHALPDAAQAQQAEGGAGKLATDGSLPSASPDKNILLRNVAGDRNDQAPGKLGSRPARPAGAQTVTPRPRAAARSMDALAIPGVTSSFR